jgi:hypothetical protein
MHLEAYLDEAGTHTSSPCVTVGGLMAASEDWAALSERWNAALAQFGVPYFHATDFEARQDVFKPLDNENRFALQTALIDSFRDAPVFAHTFCLWRGGPEEWEGPLEKELKSPYRMTMNSCLAEFGIQADMFFVGRNSGDERVDFTCDTQKQWGGKAREVFDGMKVAPLNELPFRNRLGNLAFADSRKSPPLQMADLVVYEIWKDCLNRDRVRPDRRSFVRLTSHLKISQQGASKSHLEQLGAKVYFDEYLLPKARAGLAALREERNTKPEKDQQ